MPIIEQSRAHFSHLLQVMPALNVLFQKQNASFSTKNSKNTCRLGVQTICRNEGTIVPFY